MIKDSLTTARVTQQLIEIVESSPRNSPIIEHFQKLIGKKVRKHLTDAWHSQMKKQIQSVSKLQERADFSQEICGCNPVQCALG